VAARTGSRIGAASQSAHAMIATVPAQPSPPSAPRRSPSADRGPHEEQTARAARRYYRDQHE
jgi:hypothetical protein